MPMREELPARNSYTNNPRRQKNTSQAGMGFIESRDLIVVSGVATFGVLSSVVISVVFPAFDELVALAAQFP